MSFLQKLLNRRKKTVDVLSLINLNDEIIKPPKEFFEQVENRVLHDYYFIEYQKIASSSKTLLSMDFNIFDDENVNLYIDILTHIEIEINEILDVLNQRKERNESFFKIITAKLKGYLYIIKKIENESFLKIAALTNLKNQRGLTKNKKEAIDYEISRLQFQILNCQKDGNVLKFQVEAYLKMIESLHLDAVEDENSYYRLISERLTRYLRAFNVQTKENFTIENIAFDSINLEKILFSDKQVLNNLESEIEALPTNPNLNEINKLIDKYMAIKEYKGEERPELLNELVTLKFNYLTSNFNNKSNSLDKECFYEEEKIIFSSMLETLANEFFMDENKIIFNKYVNFCQKEANWLAFKPKDYQDLMKLVRQIITKNGEYNYQEILKDPLLTSFILSLNEPQKLVDFFNNTKIKPEDYEKRVVTLNHPVCTKWEDEIPLKTLMSLINEMLAPNRFGDEDNDLENYIKTKLKQDNELYPLSTIYKTYISGKTYDAEIYEGAKYVDYDIKQFHKTPNLYYALKGYKYTTVPQNFPKSVEGLNINYNKGTLFVQNLTPSNIKELGASSNRDVAVVVLPPSIKILDSNDFIKTVIFTDFTHSNLLQNEKCLSNFINNTFGYTFYNDPDLKVEYLIFQSEYLPSIIIDLDKILYNAKKQNITDKDSIQKHLYTQIKKELLKSYDELLKLAKRCEINELAENNPNESSIPGLIKEMASITDKINDFFKDKNFKLRELLEDFDDIWQQKAKDKLIKEVSDSDKLHFALSGKNVTLDEDTVSLECTPDDKFGTCYPASLKINKDIVNIDLPNISLKQLVIPASTVSAKLSNQIDTIILEDCYNSHILSKPVALNEFVNSLYYTPQKYLQKPRNCVLALEFAGVLTRISIYEGKILKDGEMPNVKEDAEYTLQDIEKQKAKVINIISGIIKDNHDLIQHLTAPQLY